MSITIRENRHGVSIRATGDDGQRLLRAVCGALAPQLADSADKVATRRTGKPAGASDAGAACVCVTLKADAAADRLR